MGFTTSANIHHTYTYAEKASGEMWFGRWKHTPHDEQACTSTHLSANGGLSGTQRTRAQRTGCNTTRAD